MDLPEAQRRTQHHRTARGLRTVVTSATAKRGDPETWLPVIGFEDSYEVSSKGRVRSWRKGSSEELRDKPRIMKQCASVRRGAMQVCLMKSKKKYTKFTHLLVLEAFLGPRPRGFFAIHLDDNKANNNIANLAYRSGKRGK